MTYYIQQHSISSATQEKNKFVKEIQNNKSFEQKEVALVVAAESVTDV